jgi:hypothetical protein
LAGLAANSKSVTAQEALNLTLPVEYGDPVLIGDDRQIQLLGQAGARFQIERCGGACLNLKIRF